VALVFGAGSCGPGWGNGKAAAVAYAREGAAVAAVDLELERARDTAKIIAEEAGRCIAIAADVTSLADVERAVTRTLDAFDRIDILHNNVGIGEIIDPISLSETEWDRTIDTNLKSIFLTCKQVLPVMLEQKRGVIINVSSVGSIRAAPYPLAAYNASKAGLNQFTRTVAVAYAAKGIRANAILPGFMNTPLLLEQKTMIDHFGGVEEMMRARDAMSPTGKQGDAWDIANAAVFLASDEAMYINGVLLPVDGGLSCKTG